MNSCKIIIFNYPDLALCKFCYGLFLGTLTYVNHLRMLQEDLNANIWAETAIIPASNAGKGHENVKNWLIQCMDNREHHLPDLIFKTV